MADGDDERERIDGPADAESGGAAAPGTPLGDGALGGSTTARPELDADAVDESGGLDEEGETVRETPALGDDAEYPTATEDRPDAWDYNPPDGYESS